MVTELLISKAMKKSLDSPDDIRKFNNGEIRFLHLEDTTIACLRLEPGWQWSKDVQPIVNTQTCMEAHIQYVLSGRLLITMDDGTEMELKSGDAAVIPAGHQAQVLGSEPFIAIDFSGMKHYAEQLPKTDEEQGDYFDFD